MQAGHNIILVYPVVTYSIPSRAGLISTLVRALRARLDGSLHEGAMSQDYGGVTVNAFMAALLRTDVNSDPMGIYPVKVLPHRC